MQMSTENGDAGGFNGPLELGDERCPACRNDQADPTLHAIGCPRIAQWGDCG